MNTVRLQYTVMLSTIQVILMIYPHIRSSIFSKLQPSDISRLCVSTYFKLDTYDKYMFLNPTYEILTSDTVHNSTLTIVTISKNVKLLTNIKRPTGTLHTVLVSDGIFDTCDRPRLNGIMCNSLLYGTRRVAIENVLLMSVTRCPEDNISSRVIRETLLLIPEFKCKLDLWVSTGENNVSWSYTIDCVVSKQSNWEFDKVLIEAYGKHESCSIDTDILIRIIKVKVVIPLTEDSRIFTADFIYNC